MTLKQFFNLLLRLCYIINDRPPTRNDRIVLCAGAKIDNPIDLSRRAFSPEICADLDRTLSGDAEYTRRDLGNVATNVRSAQRGIGSLTEPEEFIHISVVHGLAHPVAGAGVGSSSRGGSQRSAL